MSTLAAHCANSSSYATSRWYASQQQQPVATAYQTFQPYRAYAAAPAVPAYPVAARTSPVQPAAVQNATSGAAALRGPISGLDELKQRVVASPSVRGVIAQLRQMGRVPQITLAQGAPLEPGDNGRFVRDTNTVYVDAALLRENPQQAVVTLSHELYHALDLNRGVSGRIDAAYDDVTSKLVTESRAYAFQAKVMHELGYGAPVGHVGKATYAASSPQQAYSAAWNALIQRDQLPSRPLAYAPGATQPY